MAAPFWIYKKAHLWHFPEPSSVYTKARACLNTLICTFIIVEISPELAAVAWLRAPSSKEISHKL